MGRRNFKGSFSSSIISVPGATPLKIRTPMSEGNETLYRQLCSCIREELQSISSMMANPKIRVKIKFNWSIHPSHPTKNESLKEKERAKSNKIWKKSKPKTSIPKPAVDELLLLAKEKELLGREKKEFATYQAVVQRQLLDKQTELAMKEVQARAQLKPAGKVKVNQPSLKEIIGSLQPIIQKQVEDNIAKIHRKGMEVTAKCERLGKMVARYEEQAMRISANLSCPRTRVVGNLESGNPNPVRPTGIQEQASFTTRVTDSDSVHPLHFESKFDSIGYPEEI